MTVQEFIKKWKINEMEMRIFDMELEDEIWRMGEMKDNYRCEVVNAYNHNGDTVLQRSFING